MANFEWTKISPAVPLEESALVFTRDRLFKSDKGTTATRQPVKGDYPEAMVYVGPADAEGDTANALYPDKASRTVPMRHLTMEGSARSYRDARNMAAALVVAGHSVVSRIQVRDDGRYFFYYEPSGVRAATTSDDCVVPDPQSLEDIVTPVDEDCVVPEANEIETQPEA